MLYDKEQYTFRYFMRQRVITTNLVVMCIGWLTCSFNYFLIAF